MFPADAGSRAQAALEFLILWLNGEIPDGVASAPWGSMFPTSDYTVCVCVCGGEGLVVQTLPV